MGRNSQTKDVSAIVGQECRSIEVTAFVCLELFKLVMAAHLNALIISTIAKITNAIASQVSLDLGHHAKSVQPIRNGLMANVSAWPPITDGMI